MASTEDRFEELRRVASAVDGDLDALSWLVEIDGDGVVARRHRAAPSLAVRVRQHGLDGPALGHWRRRLMEVAAHHMVLEDALDRTGRVLHAAGVPWVPLKGLDLASRVYGEREERPTSDLDLLIAAEHLEPAREALIASGTQPLSDDPRAELYLREEGYAWQASDPRGGLLELHFRLWGSAPEELSEVCMAAALSNDPDGDPTLPPGGRRLPLQHAFVIAAVHTWLDAPPRGLHPWRDLRMIGHAGSAELADRITDLARQLGLELPVGMAARATSRIWRDDSLGSRACARVGEALEAHYQPSERRFADQWAGDRSVDAPLVGQVVARYRAGRAMRHGLPHLVRRRAWPHHGVVAAATDRSWPWTLRRAWYQCRAVIGAEGLADRIAAFADRRTRGPSPPLEDRS